MASNASIPEFRRANKGRVADFFGVADTTVDTWRRKGMPVEDAGIKGQAWSCDLLKVAEWKFSGSASHSDLDPESLSPSERKQWYEGEAKRRDLQIRDRELIESQELEQSLGVAYAAVAQSLLSLPDYLERRAGLSPEQAEIAEAAIHEVMDTLVERLQMYAPVTSEAE
jgi:phage terminase Nu1 subunit (DNA packaging protein)